MSYSVEVGLNETMWKAWMNTVHDYEQNVLKGKSYPSTPKMIKQKKQRYNFWFMDDDKKTLVFDSEKDFIFFMLKWG